MPFSVNCPLCSKQFKTGTSFTKHLTFKHPQITADKLRFIDEDGNLCEEPKPADLNGEEKEGYLQWLTVLVERINGALIPEYPAKWCSVDCLQVPARYFAQVLSSLGEPSLNSARDAKHRRQPIFKRSSRRLSYKIYDAEKLRTLLEEQDSLQFKPGAVFRNYEEVPDIADMNVDDALAAAKQRARQAAPKPTSRSVIEIGIGEGRKTREVEFIWWPSLFSHSTDYGKLTVRFYVQKTSL